MAYMGFTAGRDHLLDQIVGDLRSGVQMRSRLETFCKHYSFVSSIKPTSIEETMLDIDWINVMHEDLNNFSQNEVWE